MVPSFVLAFGILASGSKICDSHETSALRGDSIGSNESIDNRDWLITRNRVSAVSHRWSMNMQFVRCRKVGDGNRDVADRVTRNTRPSKPRNIPGIPGLDSIK